MYLSIYLKICLPISKVLEKQHLKFTSNNSIVPDIMTEISKIVCLAATLVSIFSSISIINSSFLSTGRPQFVTQLKRISVTYKKIINIILSKKAFN